MSVADITLATVGWIYFVLWSISFYPQVYLNYTRKSVQGLSLDFVVLNILGFAAYTYYNIELRYDPTALKEYHRVHGPGPAVELNDVVFAVHALIMSAITLGQSYVYEREEGQKTATWAKVFVVVSIVYAGAARAFTELRYISILDYLYLVSLIKMAVTMTKYVPQAMLNHQRKSTDGWSIHNVLLDLGGGVFSFLQMFLTGFFFGEWSQFTGNPIKLGLSLFSVGFDIFFMLQHYIWYRDVRSKDEVKPLLDAESGETSRATVLTSDDEMA
eukprot:Clim_evm150s157 gene=Clim_evmTU150s157